MRQGAETWKKKFLQQGMQGTAIVFGNASADDAMRSFPPSPDVVQDCFAAVFTGPEKPTSEQAAIMAGTSATAKQKQEEMAREALRKEVELHVDKKTFDAQARFLKDTNYVYRNATYRTDLVETFPSEPAVPDVFQACAKFVPVNPQTDNVSKTSGPAAATTHGEQEREAAEDEDRIDSAAWLSIVDDEQAQTAEVSKLPALAGLLERLERQSARVLANEIKAKLTDESYGALDAAGARSWTSFVRNFIRNATVGHQNRSSQRSTTECAR